VTYTRGNRTLVNQTLPHVRNWTRLGKAHPEFGGFFPLKRGAQNCLYFGVFSNDMVSDLSLLAIIFKKERPYRQTKNRFVHFEGSLTISPNLRNFGSHTFNTNCMHVLFSAATVAQRRLSDDKITAPRCCISIVAFLFSTAPNRFFVHLHQKLAATANRRLLRNLPSMKVQHN